ncbi:cytochrome P450 [Aureobasidium subglaciale]|nr:cytochrome P450 [Aureobasidium subglaciale]KAI5231801.1 cytochrome P450 [Aureobasidium subglaciale]KAI5234360.1 cytochrome P450 [Aureobasidium subglaciale]KAI5267881.1 cytochrome P450 [Aureobasidium subglaciale]
MSRGTVETAFDSDGIYYQGRADVNAFLELEVKHHLSKDQLQRRITLAWAVLRLYHVLLLARAVDKKPYMTAGNVAQRRFFLICPPVGPEDAISDATKSLAFIEQPLDDRELPSQFYRHAQNTGRVVNADEYLAKLFIFPVDATVGTKTSLKFLFVKGHQITDGLTNFTCKQNVRARDGEFLVGVWGDDDGIAANVSYDGNAIDEDLRYRNERDLLPLPPQPPGSFFVGNMTEVIAASKIGQQHLLFERWAREHGEIYRVRVGPFTEYFINSDAAVKEIFDKASAQTAERPRWIVSNEQICNQLNVLLLNASDPRWKHQRKVIHSGLTSIPRADAGLPYLHYETAKFMQELASNPTIGRESKELYSAIGRYTYSTFASQTFGMDIPDTNDPTIDYIFETGLAQIQGTLPGNHIVDILPWMDKLPMFLKPWERNARRRFKRDMSWCVERLMRIKKGRTRNVIQDAFLPRVLEDEKNLGFGSVEEAAYLSLQLIIGAADTSKMSTWSFLEAMMTYPEVQEKGHHEIVKVVGDRAPVFEDLEQIPYVRCLMKETWRWRPPVALGHPHTTTRDLEYCGYRVPKGSRLHLNAWAIQHDPDRHENPDRFWPERYAEDHTNTMQSINASDVRNRDHFAFGSGRRVCPGYHVAERSLAVAIMRLLWGFKIAPSTDAKLPLNPSNFAGEMPGNPGEHMPVTVTVRDEKTRAAIYKAFKDAATDRVQLEPLA